PAPLRYPLGATLPAPYIDRQALASTPRTGTISMNDLSPAATGNELGLLPQWNLGDLYQSPAAPAIESDLSKATGDSKAFRQSWEGKLAAASGEELASAIVASEALQDLLGRIGSYAQLVYAGNMTDPT